MYEPSEDRVVEIGTAPQSSVGAPLPAVLADEGHVYLAYIISEPDPTWDGTSVNVVSPSSEAMSIAIVTFKEPYAHFFGPPNDEAFSGHPLASRGLRPYSANVIESSSWIHALERMNSVHPYHKPEAFESYRHYVFAFHDSTFECVARGCAIEIHRGSMISAVCFMLEAMRQDAG